MATKQHSVKLSYEKGMADTQKGMRDTAKCVGVEVKFIYSVYVGHVGVVAKGGKRALKKFLEASGLSWGKTFIE